MTSGRCLIRVARLPLRTASFWDETRWASLSEQYLNSHYVMEDVLILGGPVDKTSLTLAIYGENLNPDEISSILNCQPTKAHRRGDLRFSNPRYAPFRTGAWLLNLKGLAPITAEELIEDLLSRVPTEPQVWQQLSAAYSVQLRIAIHMDGWNKGFDLTAQTIQRVSELEASVIFDIYAYGDDDL